LDLGIAGKTALVFGAAGGLGGAIARALAAEGARVAVSDINEDALSQTVADIRAVGAQALPLQWDLSDLSVVESRIQAIHDAFGGVDILVNNTGGPPPTPAAGQSVDLWTKSFQSMVLSVIAITDQVLPGMRERKWGRIVNVLNIGAKAPGANSTPTSVSRAAGLALTKAMSQENAKHGVLVNAMLVGLIESDQWARRYKTPAGEGKTYEQFLAGMAGRIPLGRMGKAEEFARMACFLCSDAGSFITGVSINVDGGASPVT
jgi:3-oxoacyl-[acyl-carrier protein] reductase